MHEIVPVFGMITGMVMMTILGVIVVKTLHGPVGQALGRKIHKGQGDGDEVAALHDQVERLEARVLEQEERLDFAERLLTSGGRIENGEEIDLRTPV